jgi:hypothetical protein
VGWRPEIVFAVQAAHSAYQAHGYDCIVTSGVEGTHSETSLHYPGSAADFRTNHVPEPLRAQIAKMIGEALGEDFDVILESTHLHVEFQPRKLVG